MKRRTVLIPVDFSAPSRRAMAWAFDYAQQAECDVHMIHVLDQPSGWSDVTSTNTDAIDEELQEIRNATQQELAAMAPAEADRKRIGTITEHVCFGKAANEILRVAASIDADLIIMGTHGHTGIESLIIGSVATKVVRQAQCTVICVKPKSASPET